MKFVELHLTCCLLETFQIKIKNPTGREADGEKNEVRLVRFLLLSFVHHGLSAINQFVLAPMSTVHQVGFSGGLIHPRCWGICFVMSSSLVSSLLRDSMFRMWHSLCFLVVYENEFRCFIFLNFLMQPIGGRHLCLLFSPALFFH